MKRTAETLLSGATRRGDVEGRAGFAVPLYLNIVNPADGRAEAQIAEYVFCISLKAPPAEFQPQGRVEAKALSRTRGTCGPLRQAWPRAAGWRLGVGNERLRLLREYRIACHIPDARDRPSSSGKGVKASVRDARRAHHPRGPFHAARANSLRSSWVKTSGVMAVLEMRFKAHPWPASRADRGWSRAAGLS